MLNKETVHSLPEQFAKEFEVQNPQYTLRIATAEDSAVLIRLINAAYMYENVGEQAFKRRDALRIDESALIQSFNEGVVLVISPSDSDQIIGCMEYKEVPANPDSTSVQDVNGYFGMLAVDPKIQRQGIGTKLVTIAEELARRRRFDVMQIQVVNRSTHLLDWYARMGYEQFGIREWKESFLTKPSAFVLMRKSLIPQPASINLDLV